MKRRTQPNALATCALLCAASFVGLPITRSSRGPAPEPIDSLARDSIPRSPIARVAGCVPWNPLAIQGE